MGDVIWDGDINPEGFAAGYTKKNGTTTFFGSGGYYVLKDAVDSEGFEIKHDLGLYQLQVGVAFDVTDAARWTLGASVYDFNKDKYGSTSSFRANGNTTDQFGLGEIFTQLDVIGLPLPLSIYGQYVQNYEARDMAGNHDRRQRRGHGVPVRPAHQHRGRGGRLQLPRRRCQRCRGRLHGFRFRRGLHELQRSQAEAEVRLHEELLDRRDLFHGRVRRREQPQADGTWTPTPCTSISKRSSDRRRRERAAPDSRLHVQIPVEYM